MNDAAVSPATSAESAVEQRRSTRLAVEVPITVSAFDALGRFFRQETTTLDVSCSGCTYRSDRYAPKDALVTLEVWRAGRRSSPKNVQARVKWIRRPKNHRDYFRVALELEVPGNVWGVSDPPADWFPHPDDIQAVAAEVPSAPEGESSRALDLAESEIAAAISVVPESVSVTSEEVLLEIDELEPVDLASEIQAEIESTLTALIERAARSAIQDVMTYTALRAKAAVDQASKESQITADHIEAAIQEVLDSALKAPKDRGEPRPVRRRRKISKAS